MMTRSPRPIKREPSTSDDDDGRLKKKSSSSRLKSIKKEEGGDESSARKREKHKKKKEKDRKKKKHKKERKRDDSSSRTSDSDVNIVEDNYDPDFRIKLEQQRQIQKVHRAAQKDRMKALETPEEKRARRLAKKLAKEVKKKDALGWNEEHLGYSNVDNPFGDTKLTETFIWGKRLQKEGLASLPKEVVERQQRQKVDQNREEMEKLKRMRMERERQKEEREMMARDEQDDRMVAWNEQEEKFHLKQATLRSQIRRDEGRAKPIDLLAGYIHVEGNEDDMNIDMHEPYHFLDGLSIRDLEDLIEDIKVYERLEGSKFADYWRDVTIIANDELSKLKKASMGMDSHSRESIHNSVTKDVADIFKGKTHSQLALLETEILRKIKSQDEGVDVGYWESLLSQLKAHMARARLRDRHKQTLKLKLSKLKGEPAEKVEGVKHELPSSSAINDANDKEADEQDEQKVVLETETEKEIQWEDLTADERTEKCADLFVALGYEPTLLRCNPAGTELTNVEQDAKRIEQARHAVKTGKAENAEALSSDVTLEREARKGMGGDEATFSVEVSLEQKQYLWSEKYRPRKPRYFNRVHTGFEWNKYNQTHYDLDNPPPKIVQGYKFNIFYPDLLDPSTIPEFCLIPCDDPDFAVLKFTAGPPYEDIAFKVVSREWEVSHKRGYKCAFQAGIFQLWFQFKRYRYRR